MEKLLDDLKKIVKFKDTVDVGDIVLIAAKKPQMLVYCLISEIVRDVTRKDEWYHVSMQFLSLPPKQVTWTLRPEQMSGQEIFTMNGEERFMKAVDFGIKKKIDDPGEKKCGPGSSLRRIK